jgi:hypothetical protein
MRYAASFKLGICLYERSDSPPAGRKVPDLFHKNVAHSATFFVKKGKKYHAAAGEDGFCRNMYLIFTPTA